MTWMKGSFSYFWTIKIAATAAATRDFKAI
jgi:hypothetical protein